MLSRMGWANGQSRTPSLLTSYGACSTKTKGSGRTGSKSPQIADLLYCIAFQITKQIYFSFSKWISSLSDDAIRGFQRAAAIGVELNEPWLVCNAAVYVWNYTTHMLCEGRYKEIIPIYNPIFEAMKTTGHAG